MQIDSIIAASKDSTQSPPRRQKIYCDKWIHDGTCAFTQLGCKYKHEMPLDKATQMSLGLNHGIPKWYKLKHQVNLKRRDSLSSESTLTNSPIPNPPHNQASWRLRSPTNPIRPTNNINSLKPGGFPDLTESKVLTDLMFFFQLIPRMVLRCLARLHHLSWVRVFLRQY